MGFETRSEPQFAVRTSERQHANGPSTRVSKAHAVIASRWGALGIALQGAGRRVDQFCYMAPLDVCGRRGREEAEENDFGLRSRL